MLLWAMPTTSTRLSAGTPSTGGRGIELDAHRSNRPLTPVLMLGVVLGAYKYGKSPQNLASYTAQLVPSAKL